MEREDATKGKGNAHTMDDLRQMQSLPLRAKIQMSRARYRAWVDEFGEENVYVAFSGGKDSTVLKHMVEQDYPDMVSVFINTGLEQPSVRGFALAQKNVIEIRPEMNFRDVIIKYGYPVISKEVSQVVQEARIGLERGDGSYQFRIERILGEGHYAPLEDGTKSQFDVSAYRFLLGAPFSISDRCCKVMNKAPARNYERKTGRKVMLATMAGESRLRRQRWLKYGCNAWDDRRQQSSNPMSFWTEQDVLQYIHENSLPIADAYGQVVVRNDGVDGQINIHDCIGDYRGCQYETRGGRQRRGTSPIPPASATMQCRLPIITQVFAADAEQRDDAEGKDGAWNPFPCFDVLKPANRDGEHLSQLLLCHAEIGAAAADLL